MVNKDRKSERLSDFPEVTEQQNQDPQSALSWARACSTTHNKVEVLLPVWGQIFFLLLPSFLPIFFLVGKKRIGKCPVFLASPTVCPLLSQPDPSSCLWSLEGSLLLPVHSQPQALQLLTHQLIHLWRQQSVGRVARDWGRQAGGKDGGRVERKTVVSAQSQPSPVKAAGGHQLSYVLF